MLSRSETTAVLEHNGHILPRVVSIFGPPGAGKTTAAREVAKQLGFDYLSSGDIARQVDPWSLSQGKMADRRRLREAFEDALATATREGRGVVVDGLPRDPTDVDLLPIGQTLFILLNARPDILIDRQLRRGRPGDEDRVLVEKRTTEQRALMELDNADGWAYNLVTWKGGLATGDKSREQVVSQCLAYVRGERSTVS